MREWPAARSRALIRSELVAMLWVQEVRPDARRGLRTYSVGRSGDADVTLSAPHVTLACPRDAVLGLALSGQPIQLLKPRVLGSCREARRDASRDARRDASCVVWGYQSPTDGTRAPAAAESRTRRLVRRGTECGSSEPGRLPVAGRVADAIDLAVGRAVHGAGGRAARCAHVGEPGPHRRESAAVGYPLAGPHTPPNLDASFTARDLDSGLAVRYPRVGGRGHSRGAPEPVGDSLADPHTPPNLD